MLNKKQPILVFAPHNFLDFSLYSIAWTKIIRKDYKFSLNGSEGSNKIFGVGMLENLLAAILKEIAFR